MSIDDLYDSFDDDFDDDDYGRHDDPVDLEQAFERLAYAVEVGNHKKDAIIARLDLILQILESGACVAVCDDPLDSDLWGAAVTLAENNLPQPITQDAAHEAIIA